MSDTKIPDTETSDTETPDFYERSVAGTDEGEQQLRPRSELTAKELLREVGAVLRMSAAEVASSAICPTIPTRIRR